MWINKLIGPDGEPLTSSRSNKGRSGEAGVNGPATDRRVGVRRDLSNSMLGMVVVLFLSSTLYAQTPAPSAINAIQRLRLRQRLPPVHDVTGVWMMRNPPGSQRGFTNYTFTKDPPELTTLGGDEVQGSQGLQWRGVHT